MATITIDDKEYDSDTLSDETKKLLASLQFSRNEIARCKSQLAVYQTAEATFANALKNSLP